MTDHPPADQTMLPATPAPLGLHLRRQCVVPITSRCPQFATSLESPTVLMCQVSSRKPSIDIYCLVLIYRDAGTSSSRDTLKAYDERREILLEHRPRPLTSEQGTTDTPRNLPLAAPLRSGSAAHQQSIRGVGNRLEAQNNRASDPANPRRPSSPPHATSPSSSSHRSLPSLSSASLSSNGGFHQPLPSVSPIPGGPTLGSNPPNVSAVDQSNPWQHHHYIAPSTSAAFASQQSERYICSTCSKAFSRPSSLRIHSHSHTGEKPFRCPHAGCGKAFSVRSNMKRHEKGCHVGVP